MLGAPPTVIFWWKKEHGNLHGHHIQVLCWGLKLAFIIYDILPQMLWFERSKWYLMKRISELVEITENGSLTPMFWVRLNLKAMQADLPSMSIWRTFQLSKGLRKVSKLLPGKKSTLEEMHWSLSSRSEMKSRLRDVRTRDEQTK